MVETMNIGLYLNMNKILKIYIIESKHQALAAYVWLFTGVCILKVQLVLLIKKKRPFMFCI